jgi:AcrR family transcriptional regulator
MFADYGVSATSYQMIADALGVTKAAIYNKFKTKDELVLAVAEMELARLEDAVEEAEGRQGAETPALLLERVVEHAIEHRRAAHILQFDPVVVRLLSQHAPFEQFLERLYAALVPGEHEPGARVQLAMLLSTIGGTVTHPLVAGLDDDTLRSELLHRTRQLLDPPDRAKDRPRARRP